MTDRHVIIVGAGIGGLTAAVDLARRGVGVTVLERAGAPGGKMRQVEVDGAHVDAGPTVFTMKPVFEEFFSDAGASLETALDLTQARTLARHAWRGGGTLDLYATVEESADAIGEFAGGKEARAFTRFMDEAREVYKTLETTFIAAQRPSPLELMRRVGLLNMGDMFQTKPFSTLWAELGRHFSDPRLRQLFGRYATYVGSSPMKAPATLMLIAHVEQEGVWLVEGGMRAVAGAIETLGAGLGATYRYNEHVEEVLVDDGRATGVRLAGGEMLRADAVVFNGASAALSDGLLGQRARKAAEALPRGERSLSAVTWCLNTKTSGFDLDYHNVFFAEDYAREFRAVFEARTVTDAPTVYVCAQDRIGDARPEGRERLLALINAPADGDRAALSPGQRAELEARAFGLLEACGLVVERSAGNGVITAPDGFEALFPGTGGALYGRANHGAFASFNRPGAHSRLPGLYLAGGSVHPGAGVPMAAMSGRLAADAVFGDFGS
jgi:1-hydroxycarotenoid 3,4-desaturase